MMLYNELRCRLTEKMAFETNDSPYTPLKVVIYDQDGYYQEYLTREQARKLYTFLKQFYG